MKAFETRKRANGETFVTLGDDAPEWVRDAVYEAHGGDMPDDWTLAECSAAFDACESGELADEDAIHAYAEGRVDVYTAALYRWAADHCLGDVFGRADDEADETGPYKTTVDRLTAVQYHAIASIARTIRDAYFGRKGMRTVVVEARADDPFSVCFHVQGPGADAWADAVGSIDGGTWESCGDDFVYDHGTLRPGCYEEWERDGWKLDCSMAPSDDPFDAFYGLEGDALEAEINRHTVIGLHENEELKEEIRARVAAHKGGAK